jgi:hypothetical protein
MRPPSVAGEGGEPGRDVHRERGVGVDTIRCVLHGCDCPFERGAHDLRTGRNRDSGWKIRGFQRCEKNCAREAHASARAYSMLSPWIGHLGLLTENSACPRGVAGPLGRVRPGCPPSAARAAGSIWMIAGIDDGTLRIGGLPLFGREGQLGPRFFSAQVDGPSRRHCRCPAGAGPGGYMASL